MTNIRVEITEGLRPSEVVASFTDFSGNLHFIRVDQDFLVRSDNAFYLPVATVHVDPQSKAHLIELPHEAETGANRLWIKPEQLQLCEAAA